MKCPVICDPGLGTGHSTTISVVDQTLQLDGACNNAMFITDEEGLANVADPTGDAYLFTNIQDGARAQVITGVADALLHFDADGEVVKFARAVEENQGNGLASFFYVGLWDKSNSETLVDALDAIEACQPCWLPFTIAKQDKGDAAAVPPVAPAPIVDTLDIDVAAAWAIANVKFFAPGSHDVALENPIDNTNLKGRLNALGYKTTAIEYIPAKCREIPNDGRDPLVTDPIITEDWHPYREAMLPLYMAAIDFESFQSPYTWAYKPQSGQWVGIPVDNISGSAKVAVTGVFPDGSLNPANNGYANVYVKDYGNPGEWPGKTVTGHWIDEQHLLLWMQRRLRQIIANLMADQRSVPYEDARGRTLILNAVSEFMTTVYNAGWFNRDAGAFTEEANYIRTGPGGAGWGLRSDSYQSVSASRRSSRVAPPLQVCFIPAGSVHVLPITLCALADPTPVFGNS